MLQTILKQNVFGIILLTFLVVLGSCGFIANKQPQSNTTKLDERLGKEIVEKISLSSQLSVEKVKRHSSTLNKHILTGEKATTLKAMILNDQGYFFDKTKKCLFIPEIVFTFENPGDISVIFSPSCKQLKVQHGNSSFILDYDPMADQLTAFCKEILDQLDKSSNNKSS